MRVKRTWWESEDKRQRLELADCFDVFSKIPNDKIDLVLTSPPYDNLRRYEDSLVWNSEKWKFAIEELFRILKPGGVVVWIVGDATIKGSETGTSFRQALYFKEVGFNLHDTMIWNKGCFSAVGSLRSRYAPVFEFMFILSKGKPKTFNPIKDRLNKHGGVAKHGTIRNKDGSMKRMSNERNVLGKYGQRFNVWEQPPCKGGADWVGHPAPFPIQLAQDHILSWSNEDDLVLDPFAGSSTTGIAAMRIGRRFFGIEKVEKYFQISVERFENEKLK